MFSTRNRRTWRRSGVAALMAAAALVLGGCGDDTAGGEAGADVEDIQRDQAVGDAAGDARVFDDPQPFVGRQVTVSADVNRIISPHAFTIAGTENTALEPLLVLYNGNAQLTPDSVVQVTGTVKQGFRIAEAEGFVGTDLDDGLFTDFENDPYIQASSVSPIPATNPDR